MQKRFTWTSVLMLLGVLGLGCGDDGNKKVSDAGRRDAGMQKLDSGTNAATPPVQVPSDASVMQAAPIDCGATTCAVLTDPLAAIRPLLGGVPAEACCFSATDGTCGVAAMPGAACEVPAVVDTTCPSVDFGVLAALLGPMPAGGFGCCTAAGQCGLEGSLFGRGCVENSEAATIVAAIPLVGTLVMLPTSVACGQAGDGGAEDGGSTP